MNNQEISSIEYPVISPVLKRSYKALCYYCNMITTCNNIERSAVCMSCIDENKSR